MLYAIYENNNCGEEDKSPIYLGNDKFTSTNKRDLGFMAARLNAGVLEFTKIVFYYVAEVPLNRFMMESGKPGNRYYSSYRLSDFTPEEQESILAHYAKDGVGDYFHHEDVLGDRSLLHQKSKFESNMTQR